MKTAPLALEECLLGSILLDTINCVNTLKNSVSVSASGKILLPPALATTKVIYGDACYCIIRPGLLKRRQNR